MFNDSDSLQSDYNSLCSWLNLPQTQEVLSRLQVEAEGLKTIIINNVPKRDLGAFFGELMHREQSLGEIRGLERLGRLVKDRRDELERRLKILPDQLQPESID